jgi:hypothetical protein
MGRWSTVGVVLGSCIFVSLSAASGCGTKDVGSTFDSGMANGTDAAGDDGGNQFGSSGEGGGQGSSSGSSGSSGGGHPCPSGLTCNVACPTGTTTTISGTVFDPAGKNPLYGLTVYVPAGPLPTLPSGVQTTGPEACSCAALYSSGAVVSTTTDVAGKFTLKDAPVGSGVTLVVQSGKWRHVVTVPTVNKCADNPQGNINLNGSVASGSEDSLPDIAVSTGASDTLECLMKRIGLPDSEYVAGSSTAGHIHVFSGGQSTTPILTDQSGPGVVEATAMPGAPASDQHLWDSVGDLLPYDILLLSCEGGETYDAKPAVLEDYLNQGGRAFASHYHYAWFAGPLKTMQNTQYKATQSYVPPADWGSHLATWAFVPGENYGPDNGTIVQTLNAGSGMFAKGQYMSQWLANVNALGQNGVPSGDLSIYYPRYNAVVASSNTPSQPWINDVPPADAGVSGTQTMYFSFDTPVGGKPAADGGAGAYCGRAVFSDLHVSGDPSNKDTPNSRSGTGAPNGQPPPSGCGSEDLSPQEKALEFMLFDLTSCVVPDDVTPPTGIPVTY